MPMRTTLAIVSVIIVSGSAAAEDRAGVEFFEKLLTTRLEDNRLTSAGVDVIRVSGAEVRAWSSAIW